MNSADSKSSRLIPALLAVLGILFAILLIPFHKSFAAEQMLFGNDAPLGSLFAYEKFATTFFTGAWQDLNWLGVEIPSALPSFTYGMYLLWGPLAHGKFFVPLVLLLLGAGTWLFLRQLKFHPAVCLLGGIAAMLNTSPFSYACWGLPPTTLSVAWVFFTLAVLANLTAKRWIRMVLAGMAVGMCIMEGYDTGAIFSLYIAAFVMFQAWVEPGPSASRLAKGALRVAVVAFAAAFIAAHALSTLVGTQIVAAVGTGQDAKSKEERWTEATQWSLPKIEALRTVIPGLFGYRMETPNGGNYWGAVGQSPGNPATRHSGSGVFCGVLVVLGAAWALVRSFQKKDSPFSETERRWIWFWSGAALVSLLLAFGRHAPFYWFLYQLPYFSTIRNPVKFMHPFSIAVVVLFAYGLQGLWKQYLSPATPGKSIGEQFSRWWKTAAGWDRKWIYGSLGAVVVAFAGWLLYVSSKRELLQFLQTAGFPGQIGTLIAQHSFREAAWFAVLLAIGAALILLAMSGALAGRRARWFWILFGGVMLLDFTRANAPWVKYYDYTRKYSTNPVIETLRARPEGGLAPRVAGLPLPVSKEYWSFYSSIYHGYWLQHLFQYFRIQSLDVSQMPRRPYDKDAFDMAFQAAPARLWQLSNTRYLIGSSDMAAMLNEQVDPALKRFRVHTPFSLAPNGPEEITAQANPAGPYAVIEFTGALPRVQILPNWEIAANETNALARVIDPSFDPAASVLVSAGEAVPPPPSVVVTNQPAGTAELVSYAPKKVEFKAQAQTASILVLNDRYAPQWSVYVDGVKEPLLRCNYWMRGVHLTPGAHTVEFRFEPPHGTLYVSFAAIAVGLILCGLLALPSKEERPKAA